MRIPLPLVLLSVVLAVGISPAAGQSSQWSTVEALLPKTLIGIKGVNGDIFRCRFVTADDQSLSCRPEADRYGELAPTVLPKTKVYEVTLEKSATANALAGGAVGEGAGFLAARAVSHSSVFGLLVGGFYGLQFLRGGSHLHILPGRVIYLVSDGTGRR